MATAFEIPQGNQFSRSSESGVVADSATRRFRVLLSTPGESWDISQTVGVQIGDPYSGPNQIPCVSLEASADGDSKLVRIVTATYKSTLGIGSGNSDPKLSPPEQRPALYSISTSLSEIVAWGGKPVVGGQSQGWMGAYNPVGDMVDGLTRLEPVITINVDQYSASDQSSILQYSGYVNSDTFSFSNLSVGIHQCMLQSVNSRPVVEQFGGTTFRGFIVSFVFAVRRHYTFTREGEMAVGWDLAVPQTGLYIKNDGLGTNNVSNDALCLKHIDGQIYEYPDGVTYAIGTQGKKVRGMVVLPCLDGEGGAVQRQCAQPLALNDDGTPRSPLAEPPVLINRFCMQPETNFGTNFSNFGIRWIS